MPYPSDVKDLVEHFFRHESGKMIAVLTGIFGTQYAMLVEDIVQDTIVEAISNWTYKGIPEKPNAWLYRVARNKTLNAIKREQFKDQYIAERMRLHRQQIESTPLEIFSEDNIRDDQLRMMFMCCHPSISPDSQIALILKTLCGFSIKEIAQAFLTNHENINKRLVRARKTIREDQIPFSVPPKQELDSRLSVVLEAIYLLFNEGYSASTGTEVIREDLCKEAIRLTGILLEHEAITNQSDVLALLALMQLNASRFKARIDQDGNILTLRQQDRTKWNFHVMAQGFDSLSRATQGRFISRYHILASISAFHCTAKDFTSTDWQGILALYDKLIHLDCSPLVLLNRAIVLAELNRIEEALRELEDIEKEKVIASNHLFYATKSVFLAQTNEISQAKKALLKAIELAPLPAEKRVLDERLKDYLDKK